MGSPNIEASVTRPDLRAAVHREWDANGMARAFVADAIVPELRTNRKAGTIKSLTREQYLKTIDDARAPDGGYTRSDFGVGEITYDCVERAHEMPVDEAAAADMGNYFNVEQEAADIALFKALMAHEIRVAALTFNATTFTGHTTSAAVVWSSPTSATPITDITLGSQSIQDATGGIKPNTLVCTGYGWDLLKECDQVTDRLGTQSSRDPKIARLETVASILDLERIVVAGAYYDTKKKGNDASLSRIWDSTYALLCYVNPRPRWGAAFMGANIHWQGDGSQYQFRMERYRDDVKRSEIVRVRRHVVPKIVNPEFGYLISSICA